MGLNEIDIWIDVLLRTGNEPPQTVCTLFASHAIPMRPLPGETLSYHSGKNAFYEFHISTSLGPMKCNSIRVGIEDVGHYAMKTESGMVYRTTIRCEPIEVPEIEDARTACALMIEQAGFEFDPYAINVLIDDGD